MHFSSDVSLTFRKPQERQTEFGLRRTTFRVWLMKSWRFSFRSMESIQDQLLVSITVFPNRPIWMSCLWRFALYSHMPGSVSQHLHVSCMRRSFSSSWSIRHWRTPCLNPRPPSQWPSPSKQMETRTETRIQLKISTATKKKVNLFLRRGVLLFY